MKKKNSCMYWNSKLCCKCILLSNPCLKRKSYQRTSAWGGQGWDGGGLGWRTGDNPWLWVLNCKIEKNTFFFPLSLCYHWPKHFVQIFFPLFCVKLFLILPFLSFFWWSNHCLLDCGCTVCKMGVCPEIGDCLYWLHESFRGRGEDE